MLECGLDGREFGWAERRRKRRFHGDVQGVARRGVSGDGRKASERDVSRGNELFESSEAVEKSFDERRRLKHIKSIKRNLVSSSDALILIINEA